MDSTKYKKSLTYNIVHNYVSTPDDLPYNTVMIISEKYFMTLYM